jgi:hypothetical protein
MRAGSLLQTCNFCIEAFPWTESLTLYCLSIALFTLELQCSRAAILRNTNKLQLLALLPR